MKNWITVSELSLNGSPWNDVVKHLNVRYIKLVQEYSETDVNHKAVIKYGNGEGMVVRESCAEIMKKIEEAQK